jgi:uncharacterized protein (DUF2164 family)
MSEIKRQWDLLSKEKRRACLEEIITFFKQNRGEEIGVIAAEDVLDFFLQNVGADIYNKSIEDSKQLLKKQFDDLEFNLELLIKK